MIRPGNLFHSLFLSEILKSIELEGEPAAFMTAASSHVEGVKLFFPETRATRLGQYHPGMAPAPEWPHSISDWANTSSDFNQNNSLSSGRSKLFVTAASNHVDNRDGCFFFLAAVLIPPPSRAIET